MTTTQTFRQSCVVPGPSALSREMVAEMLENMAKDLRQPPSHEISSERKFDRLELYAQEILDGAYSRFQIVLHFNDWRA